MESMHGRRRHCCFLPRTVITGFWRSQRRSRIWIMPSLKTDSSWSGKRAGTFISTPDALNESCRRHIIAPIMTLNPSRFNLRDYFLGSERLPKIGNNVAIEYGGERITYDALGKLVRYYGDQLRGQGIAEGDRVALLLYDSPLFISYFLAAASIGAISVPVNTALSPDDVKFIIRDSGARLVIYEAELKEKLHSSEATLSENVEVNAKDRSCLSAEINEATNQE